MLKNHAREAEIIAHAGEKGAVTIATKYGRPWYRYQIR